MEEYKKPKLRSRLKLWIKQHRKLSLIIVGLILVVLAAGIASYILLMMPRTAVPMSKYTKPVVKAPPVYYSPLTGEVVPDVATTTLPVTGVMIENSPDARPQSGLKKAGIVFEAIAEGGITRFMALYQQEKPQLIGPVRSLRIYDTDWFAAFNASIAHVGGSAAALTEVRNGSFRDLDQFFNGNSYWRTADRYSPHNVYTSFAKLDALNATKGYTTSKFTPIPRVSGVASTKPDATSITINLSSALFNTTYAYDKTTNTYPRSQAGAPHLDREDGQIAPTVVIAMHVDESTVLQDGYREQITTIGSGAATIFQNGTATNVTWSKPNQNAQLTFTDASGKSVPLDRGQTWIAAVSNSEGSISWQ